MVTEKILTDKEKALEKALKDIEKAYGVGSIIKMGKRPNLEIKTIPSGSIGLDLALGWGGYPRGRITEIYGPESSGKTTLALHAIAEVQKLGGHAAFIDAEHALDPDYAKNLGVDIEELLVSQPDTGEQALEVTEALIRSSAVDLIVIDSVAALVPQAEIDGDMGSSHVGLQARLMSQGLRKIAGTVSKNDVVVIFINQLREKIGVSFGNPETTTGGRALKFFSTIRIDVRRAEQLKKDKEVIGNRTKVKVVKNKIAPPFKNIEFDIKYGNGISKNGELIDIGSDNDIVIKSGAWYSYKDQRIGQGRENAIQFLKENEQMAKLIEQEITEMHKSKETEKQNAENNKNNN